MDAATFTKGLWGTIAPQHRIQVWRLDDKRAHLCMSWTGVAGYAGQGAADVYTGVALTHAKAPSGSQRPRATDARAIAGLWLDIDINGGPEDKTGAASDQAAALTLARAVQEPTVIIDSGYGLHCWYLFDSGPWIFRDHADQQLAARAASGWVALHRTHADFHLDSVGDLARLMRLPGTVNAKGGRTAPVDVIATGPRHDRAELVNQAAAHAPVTSIAGGAGLSRGAPLVVDVTGAGDLGDRLELLLEADEDFAATFTHARRLTSGDDSLSAYDLSIATQLASAGTWTDSEIAAVIAAHRAHHGKPEKARRASYLNLTIGKARAAAEQRRAHDTAAALALLPRQEAA